MKQGVTKQGLPQDRGVPIEAKSRLGKAEWLQRVSGIMKEFSFVDFFWSSTYKNICLCLECVQKVKPKLGH